MNKKELNERASEEALAGASVAERVGRRVSDMHLLKNGHPAHVFTSEDRRKAAAVTKAIRREKGARFQQLRLDEEMTRMLKRDAARRRRRADEQRRRRAP